MRKIALVLVVVMAMFVFVGCGDDDGEEGDTTTTTAEETTTTEAETTTTEDTGATDEMSGQLVVPLSAQDVVPPVEGSEATGTAVFMIAPDQSGIEYALYTDGLENITAAHIHQGPPGENGGVLIWLYPEDQVPAGEAAATETTGTTEDEMEDESTTTSEAMTDTTAMEGIEGELLIQHELTRDALEAAGMTVEQLTALILSGQTYVQVHTEDNPAGALRGQIMVQPMDGSTTGTTEDMLDDSTDSTDDEMMEDVTTTS